MKTAIIFGSSGLIGNELFKTILLSNTYDKIKIFVRTIPEVNNPKVEIIKTDFRNLEKYKDKIRKITNDFPHLNEKGEVI